MTTTPHPSPTAPTTTAPTTTAPTTTAPTTTAPTTTAPTTTVVGVESAPISLSEHVRVVAEDLKKTFVPPDFWRQGRPPLSEAWRFVRHGPHLPDDDRARQVARAVTAFTLLIRGPLHVLDWVCERGSRLVVALLLVLAVVQTVNPLF